MGPSAALVHIRQLCHLGFTPELAMPALLKALHDLVPADSTGFFWVDEHYDITNICAERLLPPDVMRLYFTEFYEAPGHNFRERFSKLAHQDDVVHISTFTEQFYRSDYYNRIWKHFGAHHVMYAVIRQGARCFGQLSLYRTDREAPFNNHDRKQLASVVRYITELFTTPAGVSRHDIPLDSYYESGQSGMMVLDSGGEPEYISPQAQRLFFLLTHPQISRQTLIESFTAGGLPVLKQLSADLAKNGANPVAPPRQQTIRNCWGEFLCRGYALESSHNGAALGVYIEYREPLPLRLLNNMRTLALSLQQKEVALRLVFGYSQREIAERLHIKPTTVDYHKRLAYEKLNVHDHEGLRERLLA